MGCGASADSSARRGHRHLYTAPRDDQQAEHHGSQRQHNYPSSSPDKALPEDQQMPGHVHSYSAGAAACGDPLLPPESVSASAHDADRRSDGDVCDEPSDFVRAVRVKGRVVVAWLQHGITSDVDQFSEEEECRSRAAVERRCTSESTVAAWLDDPTGTGRSDSTSCVLHDSSSNSGTPASSARLSRQTLSLHNTLATSDHGSQLLSNPASLPRHPSILDLLSPAGHDP